jgi:hypothetical protein
MKVNPALVLRNEPLTRGTGSKPHWAEFAYRRGGEVVYVSQQYPGGLISASYQKLLKTNPNAKSWSWRPMTRNPEVFVRGRIRHPDHQVITLHCWHSVLMNTESQARAMRHVAFLD